MCTICWLNNVKLHLWWRACGLCSILLTPFYSAILWLFMVVCAHENYQKERKNKKCIRCSCYAHLVLYFMYCSTLRVMFRSQSDFLCERWRKLRCSHDRRRSANQAQWTQASIDLYFERYFKHFQVHPKLCRGKEIICFLVALIWGLLVC